eukprot:GEMP01097122.1.p1 GENE.GEMP01097122.1~~GEMP01097122.1.p1  ORF type:complete len:126 (+),score=25.83 GEMP01097122.1:145-522(+)
MGYTPRMRSIFLVYLARCLRLQTKRSLKLQACTSVMGHQYRQMVALHDWACAQGVPKDIGKAYLGAFFNSISFEPMESQHDDFRRLVEEQTPGGLNEQVVKEMEAHGTFAHLQEAVDKVKCRLFQ